MRRGRHVFQHMNDQLQTQAYTQAFLIRQLSPWRDASSSGSAASTDKFKEDLIEVCKQPSLSILALAWWTVFNTDFLANSSALPGPHAAVWPGHGTRPISKAICAFQVTWEVMVSGGTVAAHLFPKGYRVSQLLRFSLYRQNAGNAIGLPSVHIFCNASYEAVLCRSS